jgi:antitoxin (DNA-binding transcriptional repressor) of toxin-antitoxin stability system
VRDSKRLFRANPGDWRGSENLITSRRMDTPISATEASRSFSDLLNRVRYRGESFLVERGGEVVCRISPAVPPRITVAELVQLLEAGPHPDTEYVNALEEAVRTQPVLPKDDPWER